MSKITDFIQGIFNWSKMNKKLILYHFIVWTIFYLTDFAFVVAITRSKNGLFGYFGNVIFLIVYFYTLIYFLLNSKINKSTFHAIIIIITCLIISVYLKSLYDVFVIKNEIAIEKLKTKKFSYFSLEVWRLNLSNFYAVAYLVYLRSIKNLKIIRETENKLLLTEIAFLKAQINPHFLFNTLNFVFEDISAISIESGDTILKLADMMRYSVQSTKMDYAPIEKEIEAIERYIYLQRKRFGDNMFVNFVKKGNLKGIEIPPLIMLSIVENAFKYGVTYEKETPIEIYVEANQDALIFNCKNAIRAYYKETETNAVGITNIRRRLEISYKNNFELENRTENKNYFVHLKIILNIPEVQLLKKNKLPFKMY